MPDEPPYILSVTGLDPRDEPSEDHTGAVDGRGVRHWIGVQFECCSVYIRIYRNRKATAYEGCCPRCGRPVQVKIGTNGTSHRMFRAS